MAKIKYSLFYDKKVIKSYKSSLAAVDEFKKLQIDAIRTLMHHIISNQKKHQIEASEKNSRKNRKIVQTPVS